MSATIQVRHNIEVAHRLTQLPGKCEAIHGHSMWVALEIAGDLNQAGLLDGLDFGAVKRAFRGMLDTEFDHRLLLNRHDPLTELALPGLRRCDGDPTTENIARWITEWAATQWHTPLIRVRVDETHVNAATWELHR